MSSSPESFNPMDYPLSMMQPRLLTHVSAWVQHIPFAFALVEMCRPNVLVELGTLKGDSYYAFCQAVGTLKLPTRCTAIDTWAGDPHAGEYGPGILAELRQIHDPAFGRFSTLLQSNFDDAVDRFENGSIDILHIDGFHEYDAVKHDYETWVKKVSNRGVILFHDTEVRELNFGVWKLWEELSAQFPSFAFRHGFGLGVLGFGSDLPDALARFLRLGAANRDALLRYFEYAGAYIEVLRLGRTMIGNVRNLQSLLDQRNQMIGEKVETVDIQEVFRRPIPFMERTMGEIVKVVQSELQLRGLNPTTVVRHS